jgi:hypothetical protein
MDINTKLDLILQKLDELLEKNKVNDEKINNLEFSCNKMNEHINFVENTYSTLQAPLSFVKKNVERLMGTNYQVTNLPSIKDK